MTFALSNTKQSDRQSLSLCLSKRHPKNSNITCLRVRIIFQKNALEVATRAIDISLSVCLKQKREIQNKSEARNG